jgi:hypothetical protein
MDSDDAQGAPDAPAFPYVIVRECPGKANKIVGWYADLATARADLPSARVISWREGARFYIRES